MSGAPGIGTVNNWAAGFATGAFGMNQYQRGKKEMKNLVRPTYEIPQEIYQNLSQSQQQALQGMPEEQKQQFVANLQRSSAYGLSQLGTRKAGLAGVGTMNENQNQGYLNLASADSAARMENQRAVFGYRQNLADYKDQAWKVNKFDPYGLKLASAQAMMGAGIQNMGNSFQTAGGQGGGNAYRTPEQQDTSLTAGRYTNPNNDSMRGIQTGLNYNNYYNPNSPYSQSGTVVPDGRPSNNNYG